MLGNYFKSSFKNDLPASIVVFLVALPLCMGIAIASGVPPILGLLSGIIGGLVVGVFAGCPLQVSGPAAGLAVMVYEFIEKYGVEALAPLGIIIGVVQLLTYKLKLAVYFRAISPALIKGLLSGIGLLILASQVHVALDSSPIGGGLANLLHIPKSFNDLVILEGGGRSAFALSIFTLCSILLWQKFAGKISSIIPAPLFAIVTVALISYLMDAQVKSIEISSSFLNDLKFLKFKQFQGVDVSFIISALAMAFVATAETLLSVAAVDKISKQGTSDYNKEVMAQGIGNIVAGLVGAIPITGVIVRSSANIESNAKTRGSAIIHGFWLFVLVFFFTDILQLVPVSALAGILIYTGWKLLDVKSIPQIFAKGKSETFVYVITFVLIVSVDLLTGVVVGFLTSIAFLTYQLVNLDVHTTESNDKTHIKLKGTASFLHVPKISDSLKVASKTQNVVIDVEELRYLDWAVEDQLISWVDIQKGLGYKVELYYGSRQNASAN